HLGRNLLNRKMVERFTQLDACLFDKLVPVTDCSRSICSARNLNRIKNRGSCMYGLRENYNGNRFSFVLRLKLRCFALGYLSLHRKPGDHRGYQRHYASGKIAGKANPVRGISSFSSRDKWPYPEGQQEETGCKSANKSNKPSSGRS